MEMKLTEVMKNSSRNPKQRLASGPSCHCSPLRKQKSCDHWSWTWNIQETQSLVLKLIRTLEIPIILDADGLTALATNLKPFP